MTQWLAGQYDLFPASAGTGEPPSQRHSETSRAAAARIKPYIGPSHTRILTYLAGGGASDERMQREIPMPANTQRPRRRELELMGRVMDSGRRELTDSGREAVIWMLAPLEARETS